MAAEEDLTVRRYRFCFTLAWSVGLAAVAAPATAQLPRAVNGEDLADASGLAIYGASCANCHGLDGTGADPTLLAFEEEMPDFTDCDFAAREPDADWIAVAHEGGPVRGFSEMMPAFRGALTEDQLTRVMGYVRTLCTDDDWPRGELNLPRPLLTEKAYPEDEWVVEMGVDLQGDGSVAGAFVYEHRFGPRSQLEIVIPYGWRAGDAAEHGAAAANDGWRHGLGDVGVGVKHALYHDPVAGAVFSMGGEVILSTGNEDAGFGAQGNALEAFASYGQILPRDGFLQAQAGIETPLYEDGPNEAFGRLVLGASFTEGDWGRAWSPMLEMQTRREFGSAGETWVDLVPQVQVSLNTRQHVLANVGLAVPLGGDSDADGHEGHHHEAARSVRLLMYVLLDWFDGGFLEGW